MTNPTSSDYIYPAGTFWFDEMVLQSGDPVYDINDIVTGAPVTEFLHIDGLNSYGDVYALRRELNQQSYVIRLMNDHNVFPLFSGDYDIYRNPRYYVDLLRDNVWYPERWEQIDYWDAGSTFHALTYPQTLQFMVRSFFLEIQYWV